MFNAGQVSAILSGKFNPAGFVEFDSAVKRSAANAATAERQIAASHKRTSSSMAGLAKVGTVSLAAIAAGTVAAVRANMNFEKAMSAVKAATGANEQTLKRMGDAAMRLGAKYGVGAVKAANALEELGKGGMSAGQAMKALDSALTLSKAGPMDMAEAASTIVQTLSTFNLTAAESGKVADGLASAAAKSTLDIADFAQALAQGGSVAASAGFSFDETINTLGTMANRFKSGSDMGTSLKTAIQHLAAPTDKAAKEMKRLNIDMFDSHGKAKKASDLVHNLSDAFGKLTPKQKIASAALIAGSDSMRTLLNLASSAPQKIREQGSASDMARKKMDNLAGSLDRMKAQFGNIMIRIGAKVSPSVRRAVDDVTSLLTDLQNGQLLGTSGTGDMFGGLKGDIREILLTIDALIGGLTLATSAVQQFASTMGAMVPGHDAFDALAEKAQHATDNINALRENIQVLAGTRFKVPGGSVKLNVDQAGAVAALNGLRGKKLQVALQVVARGDMDAQTKIKKLIALGIPPKYARILAKGIPQVQQAIDSIKGPTIDTSSAIGKLNAIKNTKVRDKAIRIVASDDSAKAKIKALVALGIPVKQARVMATGTAAAQAQINAIHGKQITVGVSLAKVGGGIKGVAWASGRGPGQGETALVGEGGGPELVGNPRDGWRKTTGPTLMDLGASDYVIPTEPRYRGRALGLLADALGIPAFGKGKRPKAIHSQPIQYAEYLSPLEAEVQKWQERVTRDQQARNDKKDKKLTKAAKEARRKLPREKRMLAQAKRELASAKEYGAKITKQEELANIYADDMDLAKTDVAWKLARNRRTAALGREAKLLADALKLAGGPTASSAWARALRKKLGEANVGIQTANEDSFDTAKVGTFNADEQKALDKVDADIALAQLTETKSDDILMLGAKERLLVPLLAKAQKANKSGAVAEIAGLLKQTRDELKDARKPPDITADQQLQADQAFQRGVASAQGRMIDRTIDRAFGGPQIIVQTLHPGDPATVRAIGDAAAAGFGYQQPRQASTARVGV